MPKAQKTTDSRRKVRLPDFKPDLHGRLRDPMYAGTYLNAVVEENDREAIFIAVNDVAEAQFDIGFLGILSSLGIRHSKLIGH
jgi:hypothetical protein